ncbi:MAG: PaaI family thioesterase [Acidimicrobiales bacterium]
MTDLTPEHFATIGEGKLPGLLGLEVLEVSRGRVVSRLDVGPHHHAPNGFLHAATIVALADTSCGYGCRTCLPEGASGFTTIELKSNFIGTVLDGGIRCVAELLHGGRTTQLWDARVTVEADDRLLALFRCTQLVLRPPL